MKAATGGTAVTAADIATESGVDQNRTQVQGDEGQRQAQTPQQEVAALPTPSSRATSARPR